MLEAFRKAFKIKDIRKKIGYTFLMLIVIRIGSQLPTPGVNGEYIKNFFAQNTGEAFNLFNAFTGGSFEQMSVFALSITPYITSSIIVQLLTIAIPQLEEMQRDGETGRKKIVAITRYLTVGLALIESGAMAVGFGRQGLLVKYNFVNAAIVVLTLTAGSAFLMWIGERITEKGVGNGISIVLVINIISRIPSDMKTLFDQFVKGKAIASACLAVCVIIAIILALVVFTVILQDGERRIAVQYSQKIVGRRSYGGQSTNIPLKVNTAGVIPIIFSSSLMQFPIVIASFLGKDNTDHCDIDGKDMVVDELCPPQLKDLNDCINKYGDEIEILKGIEIGQGIYRKKETEALLKKYDYDFVLGSLHNLENMEDFFFLDYKNYDIDELLTRYFDGLLELCQWGAFDSLAHLTYPLRYIVAREKINVDMNKYQDVCDAIFEELIKNDKALEINIPTFTIFQPK